VTVVDASKKRTSKLRFKDKADRYRMTSKTDFCTVCFNQTDMICFTEKVPMCTECHNDLPMDIRCHLGKIITNTDVCEISTYRDLRMFQLLDFTVDSKNMKVNISPFQNKLVKARNILNDEFAKKIKRKNLLSKNHFSKGGRKSKRLKLQRRLKLDAFFRQNRI